MSKKKKWYWLFTHFECPICGHETVYQERVYKKPLSTHVIEIDGGHSYYCLG